MTVARPVKAKQFTPQMRIGQVGINMIESTCLNMHCTWNPTGAVDVGIDGYIEMFHRKTGDALGKHLAVQSKVVSSLGNDRGETFDFSCRARDIAYWRQGNMPVLLIVSCPSTNEQYWVSVKDYFDDPERRSGNTVRFHKMRNRFSEASYEELVRMGPHESAGLYLGPVPKKETLICNLLPLTGFPGRVWVGESRFKRSEQIWPILNARRRVGGDWILREGSVISFQNLQEYPWTNICDLGTCEDFGTEEWSDSDDPDRQRHFVELLNRALSEQLYPDVRHRREWDCYAFACKPENAPLRMQYQSLERKSSKTVVQDYENTNAEGEQFVWLRHLAFKPQFKRFDRRWYLEITPTYVFTWDGRRLYRFHEEWLSRIKQIEKNRAVLSALVLWADYLGNESPDLFSDPALRFGRLMSVDLPVGIDDNGWSDKGAEDGEAESAEDEDADDLFARLANEGGP